MNAETSETIKVRKLGLGDMHILEEYRIY